MPAGTLSRPVSLFLLSCGWLFARRDTFTHVARPAIELARMIVEGVPCADKVRLVNSGTEAVLLAL